MSFFSSCLLNLLITFQSNPKHPSYKNTPHISDIHATSAPCLSWRRCVCFALFLWKTDLYWNTSLKVSRCLENLNARMKTLVWHRIQRDLSGGCWKLFASGLVIQEKPWALGDFVTIDWLTSGRGGRLTWRHPLPVILLCLSYSCYHHKGVMACWKQNLPNM